MASAYVASLIARRDQAAADLAAIASKPSYSVDGESYDWPGLRRELMEEISTLTKMIAAADGGQDVSHHARGVHGW